MIKTSRRMSWGIALLVLTVLTALNYWQLAWGKTPLPADMVTQFPPWDSVRNPLVSPPKHAEMGDLVTELYPWKAFTRRTIQDGAFPLWNPHILLGAPFVGDPQTGLFYPLNLVYFFLPTPLAWSLSFLLRTILAGLLTSLLARTLGASGIAALMAGIVFAFCGWVTAFQTRPHLDTCLWLPLALFAVDRLRRFPSGTSVALGAVAFALPVLAGQPESAAHVTLVAVLFFLYRLTIWSGEGKAHPTERDRLRFLSLFGAAGLLAVGLAAVQALPTLEWIGHLDRGLDSAWGPKPVHELAAFLSRDLGSSPNSAGVSVPESAAYAGMLTLLLAPLALLHRNRRDAIFFAILAVCAVEIVYGLGPVYWLSQRIPILRGIPNGRLLVVVDLSLAMLAGLGMTALQETLKAADARAKCWIMSSAAFFVAAVGVWLIASRARDSLIPARALSFATVRGPLSSAIVLLAAAVLLALALGSGLSRPRFEVLAVAFMAADLVTASYRFIPFASPEAIFPPAPTFRFLREDGTPHRVVALDRTYGASFEMMYGLQSPTGFTVPLRRAQYLLSTLGFENDAPRLEAARVVASRNRILDLMNVKYLAATTWNSSAGDLASRPDRFRLAFSDASVRVFENLSVLPRAFLVPSFGSVVLAEEGAQLERLRSPDFDPARSVIVAEPVPPSEAVLDRTVVPAVTRFEQSVNEVRFHASTTKQSVAVLSQMHFPGWRVFVDNREQAVLRVDYAFTGVVLPPGTHDVRFVFRPWTLRLGALVTGAAFLICVGLCVLARRHCAPSVS